MSSLEIDAPRGLSREARAGAGQGSPKRGDPGMPAASQPPLTRAELLQIMSARVVPAREWSRPVFFGDEAHISIASLQASLAKQRKGLPAFVYGSRSLRSELNATALLAVIFPDGVPPTESMPLELQGALKNLMQAAKDVYSCPGMERLEIDKSLVIVCNDELILTMMETCIAKSGQEL